MERHNCQWHGTDENMSCEVRGCMVARVIREELSAFQNSRYGTSPSHLALYINSHPCDSAEARAAREEAAGVIFPN